MIIRNGDRYLIQGPVTLENVNAMLDEVERSLDGARVVVDLSGVTEVDSSAVSLLLEWTRRVRSRSGEIEFTGVGKNLLSLTDLYGVAALIRIAAE
jgi:phospholipid transport system transporter-binding protein